MRKITEQAAQAFNAGHTFNGNNTQVSVHHKGVNMYLFGHKIAERINGKLFINSCGWKTVTTKERLNGLPGVSIYQNKGEWYLNGKLWNGERIQIK